MPSQLGLGAGSSHVGESGGCWSQGLCARLTFGEQFYAQSSLEPLFPERAPCFASSLHLVPSENFGFSEAWIWAALGSYPSAA